MSDFVPTFRYHQTEAPTGRKFTSETEFLALSDEWVDTPAKFLPPDAENQKIPGELPEIPERRRGRPRKGEQ